MPRLNLTHDQAIEIKPVLEAVNGTNKVIQITVKRGKNLFRKGDRLFLYVKNYNWKWMRLGIVACKYAQLINDEQQQLTLRNTYDRRYYLNRRLKKAGFSLELEQTSKTILVPPCKVKDALENKALNELGKNFNYGVQFTIDYESH